VTVPRMPCNVSSANDVKLYLLTHYRRVLVDNVNGHLIHKASCDYRCLHHLLYLLPSLLVSITRCWSWLVNRSCCIWIAQTYIFQFRK